MPKKNGKIEIKMKANAKTPTMDYAIDHIYKVSKKEYELIKLSCMLMKDIRAHRERMAGHEILTK